MTFFEQHTNEKAPYGVVVDNGTITSVTWSITGGATVTPQEPEETIASCLVSGVKVGVTHVLTGTVTVGEKILTESAQIRGV